MRTRTSASEPCGTIRSTTPAITLRALRPEIGPRASRMSSARISIRTRVPAGCSSKRHSQDRPGIKLDLRVSTLGGMFHDAARQDVAHSLQVDERRASHAREHIQRRPLGDDLASLQKKKPSANGDRLGRAMRHVQDGDLLDLLNPAQAIDELIAIGQVDGRDRLIAEQEPRTRRERSRQPDPLPLTARERFGAPVEQMFHAAKR